MAFTKPFPDAVHTPRGDSLNREGVYVVIEMLNHIPQGVYDSWDEIKKAHGSQWMQLTPWHWRNDKQREGRLEVTRFFINQGLKK